MIDPERYYIIVNQSAVFGTGLREHEIRNRLCAIKAQGEITKDFIPGQATTIEDDGRVKWTVTRSHKLAPDGVKTIAFVVASQRYRQESESVSRGVRFRKRFSC